jgi:nitroimidazol reductase NimA-like FMN-containing flavoprotein (pyridoxamine 5'-phosphate oxidase superfamily)
MDLTELRREECLRLLAGQIVGRLVHTEAALPAAHPVIYHLDGDEIVFRTGDGSKLAAAARRHVVGFQVDLIDEPTRTGWSVLGVGMAYEVTDPSRLAALADRMPPPWVPDRTGHVIAVPLQRLTGRRLSAGSRDGDHRLA